ncbi:MAG: hypothetical protein WB507_10755 [Solirubrobacterales bacterium]
MGLRFGMLAVVAFSVLALEGNQETGFGHRNMWAIDGQGQILPTQSFDHCRPVGNGQSRCISHDTGRPVYIPPVVPSGGDIHGTSALSAQGLSAPSSHHELRRNSPVNGGSSEFSCAVPTH